MRILITGARGMLGSCLSKTLKEAGVDVVDADIPEYNIISFNSIKSLFNPDKPYDFLINCAAYTDVPKAELDQKAAYYLNAQACGILSRVCIDNNIHFIHFSTDFVFDGKANRPYTEKDTTNPLNYYGMSKLQGENIIKNNMTNYTIFRLQWLFGDNEKTFFSKLLKKSQEEKVLKIVQDEIGSPCSVDFISDMLLKIINLDKKELTGKTYHLTHNNYCSRYDCGKYYLDKIGWKGQIIPALTTDFLDPVSRPKFGALDTTKITNKLRLDLGTWESDIDNYLKT